GPLYERLGYATLTVDYRAGAEGIDDVDAFYHSARRRVGRDLPICAIGASAGGHIALMLAVRNPDLACVIDLEGPTDLTSLAPGSAAYDFAVRPFGKSELAAFSPALQARAIRAKVMLAFARNDPLVPVNQGVEMARALPGARLIVLPPGPAVFIHVGNWG